MLFLQSVFSFMLSHSTSAVQDSSASHSAAEWQHKYKSLEAEHASAFGTKFKRYVIKN